MVQMLPVASGKGGVGKTVFTANLGVSLARSGKTVVLVDLDLGGSNLHTCLGIRNRHPGIGHLLQKQERNLAALLVPTEIRRLHFIPGDALMPGTANLSYHHKRKIIRELGNLPADYVLLDLGSGTSYNTVDFFLASPTGIVVITPETTSILNAYSFLKMVLFRMLERMFPRGSREREIVHDFLATRIEASESSFEKLVRLLAQEFPESADEARRRMRSLLVMVVVNMGESPADLNLAGRLRSVAGRNLNLELEYIGFLRTDPAIRRSVLERRPAVLARPDCLYSRSLFSTAQRLLAKKATATLGLHEPEEDLVELAREIRDD
jgi:flagellar biosynthesis protein FlhG